MKLIPKYNTGGNSHKIKYYGAYSPKDQAYLLPKTVDKEGMTTIGLPEVKVTPSNNTDLGVTMQGRGNFGKNIAEFTPVGDVIDIYNIGKDTYKGNYGQAALGAGLMFLPDVVAKPVKRLFRKANKWITAPKRADKLSDRILNDQQDLLKEENDIKFHHRDNFEDRVSKEEQEFIKNNPDVATYSKQKRAAEEFKKAYEKERKNMRIQYSDINFEDYYKTLPLEKQKQFKQLINDDPLYMKFAIGQNLPFDSQDTVDRWIQKQRTGIRGVYSDIPNANDDILEPMFTLTKPYNPGGDRLKTDGGLYVSNSMDIANRFSRSQTDKPGTAAYGYTSSKDINRLVPIREQLAQLRRRIYPYDLFKKFSDKSNIDLLKKHGYIGKQSQYTTGQGEMLPAYETSYFSDTPGTKVVDVSDITTSDVTKDLAGRWGKGAGGADVKDILYSPRVIANSFGDFVHEYRTYMDMLPAKEKTGRALLPEQYWDLRDRVEEDSWKELETKLIPFQRQKNNLLKAQNKVMYKLEPRINKNVNNIKTGAIGLGALGTGIGGYSIYNKMSTQIPSDELNKKGEP